MNAADVAVIRGYFGKRHPQTRYDYDGNNNCTYIGVAPKGTAVSAANWLIFKLTYNASNLVTLVQSAEDAVWNDRATTTYG